MGDKLELISGGLMNIVLGALILWVGQTTFQHAGQLASVDEKFLAFDQQFEGVDKRSESLRRWLEKKFSTEDAGKLVEDIRRVDTVLTRVERRLTDRLTDVEVKLSAVETRDMDGHQLAALQGEIAQLRAALGHQSQYYGSSDGSYQPAASVAQGTPVFLPPTGIRR